MYGIAPTGLRRTASSSLAFLSAAVSCVILGASEDFARREARLICGILWIFSVFAGHLFFLAVARVRFTGDQVASARRRAPFPRGALPARLYFVRRIICDFLRARAPRARGSVPAAGPGPPGPAPSGPVKLRVPAGGRLFREAPCRRSCGLYSGGRCTRATCVLGKSRVSPVW